MLVESEVGLRLRSGSRSVKSGPRSLGVDGTMVKCRLTTLALLSPVRLTDSRLQIFFTSVGRADVARRDSDRD